MLIHKLRQRRAAGQQATESRLTYYLSGVPKARPLEGWVRWPANDAPLKGLTERSAERRRARLRFERQRLTCIRSLYFKLGAMANASTRSGQRWAQVSLAAAQMCGEASALVPGHSSVPVRLGSRSKAAVAGGGIVRVTVKIRAFEEQAKPRTYTSQSNEGRRGSKRQKAT